MINGGLTTDPVVAAYLAGFDAGAQNVIRGSVLIAQTEPEHILYKGNIERFLPLMFLLVTITFVLGFLAGKLS